MATLALGHLTQRRDRATAQDSSRMVEANLETSVQVSALGHPSYIHKEMGFYVPLALRGAWLCVRLAPHTPERFYIRSIYIERISSYPISGHCYFYPLFYHKWCLHLLT